MLRIGSADRSALPLVAVRAPTVALIMVLTAALLAVVAVVPGPVPSRWLSAAAVLGQAGLLVLVPTLPIGAGLAAAVLGGVVLDLTPVIGMGLAPAAVFTASALHPPRGSWPAAAAMAAVAPVSLVHGTRTGVLLGLTAAVAAWSLGLWPAANGSSGPRRSAPNWSGNGPPWPAMCTTSSATRWR
jgi:hypothetical protein